MGRERKSSSSQTHGKQIQKEREREWERGVKIRNRENKNTKRGVNRMHTGRQHEKQSGEEAGGNRRSEGCVQHNNKYEKLCRIKLESWL